MVIDTSALIAILLAETDAARIVEALKIQSSHGDRFICAATFLETNIVIF